MTTLTIGDQAFKNATSFSMSSLNLIETIDIGNDCFKSIANDLRLNHFPELISLRIGNSSFYNETNNEAINNVFQMYNNSKLLSIEIGEYSFSNYANGFTLMKLPSLQNLIIGSIENESNNFMNAPSFSISSINETII